MKSVKNLLAFLAVAKGQQLLQQVSGSYDLPQEAIDLFSTEPAAKDPSAHEWPDKLRIWNTLEADDKTKVTN